MQPRKWLEHTGQSISGFARDKGFDPGTISKYVNGKIAPSFLIVGVFWKASRGLVSTPDWMKTFPRWRDGLDRRRNNE